VCGAPIEKMGRPPGAGYQGSYYSDGRRFRDLRILKAAAGASASVSTTRTVSAPHSKYRGSTSGLCGSSIMTYTRSPTSGSLASAGKTSSTPDRLTSRLTASISPSRKEESWQLNRTSYRWSRLRSSGGVSNTASRGGSSTGTIQDYISSPVFCADLCVNRTALRLQYLCMEPPRCPQAHSIAILRTKMKKRS
jgi:hypothetical protein